ncbi:MAG: hypothetical protein GXO34_02760 [Deltaproteobacteria bacterium]|nr:hypothetical protein [Deltaproteobacteria bacterium]
MKENFDAYISLGDNCEPGLQFRRIGYQRSSLFRYTTVTSNALITLINNDFSDLFLKENLEPAAVDHMVFDRGSGMAFHSRLYSRFDPDIGKRTFRTDYDFDKIYRQEKNKVDYLVDKWHKLAASSQKVLYFFKNNQGSSRKEAVALRDTLANRYPEHDFLILYLQPRSLFEPPWGEARLANVYLDHLAPYDNALKGADRQGWNHLFRNYPLKHPPGGKLIHWLRCRF